MKNSVNELPPEIGSKEDLEKYMKEVALVTWKMSIQRPPMRFDVSGVNKKWKAEEQISYTAIKHPESAVVKFYVHPTLYHGDTLMAKGMVSL